MASLFALKEALASVALDHYPEGQTMSAPEYDYMNGLVVCDVSKWQGDIDFKKMKAAGACAVAIRATVGDYYTDDRFEEFWQLAKEADLLVSSYHVVTPEKPKQAQMERYLNVMGMRTPDFQPVLDCELSRDQTSERITNVIKFCADYLMDFYGDCMIYTSSGYWNAHVNRRDYWSNYPLWVAHYTSAQKPLLPADWNQWEMWQWSAGGNGQGAKYGASSRDIDLNRVRDPNFLPLEPILPPTPDPIRSADNVLPLDGACFYPRPGGDNTPVARAVGDLEMPVIVVSADGEWLQVSTPAYLWVRRDDVEKI